MESRKYEFKSDSPGLYCLLLKVVSDSALVCLEEAYEVACLNGGKEEPRIRRPEGASFNPRPTRIAHILLTECQQNSGPVLGTAMLASCNMLPEGYEVGALRQEHLWSIKAREWPQDEGGPAFLEQIFLAVTLDTARHLHMMEISDSERDSFISHVRSDVIPSIKHPESRRLKTLLSAWAERHERE